MKPNDEMKLLTVLITTRNRPEDLGLTLRNLKQQTYGNVEVLIIDDDSDESLLPVVQQWYPEAVFLRNEKNLGLIGSRSLGMSMARGEYVLTLDDDASFTDPEDIARAVARLEQEPEVGILRFFIHNGIEPPDLSKRRAPEQYTDTYIGCGNVIRKSVIRELGGYRDFFYYGNEEGEYSLRALDAGWRILLFPSVVVHHRVSPIGRSSGKIFAYGLRNSLWILVLLMPWRRVVAVGSWRLFFSTIEMVRRLEFGWWFWGVRSFLSGLPAVLKLRKPVSRETVRRYEALRFHKIYTRSDYESARPPSLTERWNWFRTVWRRRKRMPAFWARGSKSVSR